MSDLAQLRRWQADEYEKKNETERLRQYCLTHGHLSYRKQVKWMADELVTLAEKCDAKDAEIERLREINYELQFGMGLRDKHIAKLQAVVDDIYRWLGAFIKAWDDTAPHKQSEAAVALMEAIRRHSTVVAALETDDE